MTCPVLEDYISSRVNESPEKLFFFNASELNTYRNASENSKAEIPGAAYLSKIESFIEDHYVRGELFFEFGRDTCNKQSDASSTLCSWCTNNRWVGPAEQKESLSLCQTSKIPGTLWMCTKRRQQVVLQTIINRGNV